jgi:hypothetical protein
MDVQDALNEELAEVRKLTGVFNARAIGLCSQD